MRLCSVRCSYPVSDLQAKVKREKRRAYLLANKERIAERRKAYRLANREKISASDKHYRLQNKELISKRRKLDYRKKQVTAQDQAWELYKQSHNLDFPDPEDAFRTGWNRQATHLMEN